MQETMYQFCAETLESARFFFCSKLTWDGTSDNKNIVSISKCVYVYKIEQTINK